MKDIYQDPKQATKPACLPACLGLPAWACLPVTGARFLGLACNRQARPTASTGQAGQVKMAGHLACLLFIFY
jgi:hypothetical protein